MAAESPHNLLKLWRQERIPADMAIGYLIQNQVKHEQAIVAANLSRAGLRNEVDSLVAQVKTHQRMLKALQSALARLQSAVDGLSDQTEKGP